MKKIRKRRLIIICSVLIGVILLACVTIGILILIASKKATYEADMSLLEIRYKFYTTDINDNYRLAIEKYQNKRMDPEPILLAAWLQEYSLGDYELVLRGFNEDKDLLGIILKEESYDPNGNINTTEERYPIFIYELHPRIVTCHEIPVAIRTNNQRKDEKSWEDYLSKDFGYLREQANDFDLFAAWEDYLKKNFGTPHEQSHKFDMLLEYYEIVDQWKETLPTVWISNPETSDVTVWVQLYDKAGNESNYIKLIEKVFRPS